MSKWGSQITKTKELVSNSGMDPDALAKFIGNASAEKDVSPEQGASEIQAPKRLMKKIEKEKKPLGRPKVLGEVVRQQFDIPVELVNKLTALAGLRYGDNKTKALIAVLAGKDKL